MALLMAKSRPCRDSGQDAFPVSVEMQIRKLDYTNAHCRKWVVMHRVKAMPYIRASQQASCDRRGVEVNWLDGSGSTLIYRARPVSRSASQSSHAGQRGFSNSSVIFRPSNAPLAMRD